MDLRSIGLIGLLAFGPKAQGLIAHGSIGPKAQWTHRPLVKGLLGLEGPKPLDQGFLARRAKGPSVWPTPSVSWAFGPSALRLRPASWPGHRPLFTPPAALTPAFGWGFRSRLAGCSDYSASGRIIFAAALST